MNKCIFVGHIAHDLELKQAGDTHVVNFHIAIRDSHRRQDGTYNHRLIFLPCEAWDTGAQTLVNKFHKGKPIIVEAKAKQVEFMKDDRKEKRIIFRILNFNEAPREWQSASEENSESESESE